MTKKIYIIPFLIFDCFFLIWLGLMIRGELLTKRYGDDFPYPEVIRQMCGEMDYLKVLEINDSNALVYYVSNRHTIGNTASFSRQGNHWTFVSWVDTVWSSAGGSADGFILPYWYRTHEGFVRFVILCTALLAATILLLIFDRSKAHHIKKISM